MAKVTPSEPKTKPVAKKGKSLMSWCKEYFTYDKGPDNPGTLNSFSKEMKELSPQDKLELAEMFMADGKHVDNIDTYRKQVAKEAQEASA